MRRFEFEEHKLPGKLRQHLFPTIHVDKTHPLELNDTDFYKIVCLSPCYPHESYEGKQQQCCDPGELELQLPSFSESKFRI